MCNADAVTDNLEDLPHLSAAIVIFLKLSPFCYISRQLVRVTFSKVQMCLYMFLKLSGILFCYHVLLFDVCV